MPRKTRKQKTLAQIHRVKLVKKQNAGISASGSFVFRLPETEINQTVTKAKTASVSFNHDYILRDLVKITIFLIITFIIEAVLYFVLKP